MADAPKLANILAGYGEGYVSPALSGDSEIYDTSNVLARMLTDSALTRGARGLAETIRSASVPNNILAGGLDSGANWLDWTPEPGRDTATPLGAAAMYAPFALRAAAPRAMGAPTEWPTQAAVRVGDRTFTGNSHYDAMLDAEAKLGPQIWTEASKKQIASGAIDDGFLTNTGRYVSREEAGRMLDTNNQTRHYQTWLGNPKKGKNGLISEALDAYDPKTGREAVNPADITKLYE